MKKWREKYPEANLKEEKKMWTDNLADVVKAMEKIQKHYDMTCYVECMDNNRIALTNGDVWVMENGDVHLTNEPSPMKTYELDVEMTGKLIVNACSADEALEYYYKSSLEDLATTDRFQTADGNVRSIRVVETMSFDDDIFS